MPAPGSTIGPYRIDREIGRGGMGVVFLAHDTRLDRAVALKALPEGVVADADALARFEREAKTLASLNHPNIATIHGVEESEGVRYLALEYIEGETLADRLLRGPVPPRDLLPIAIQIATGMEVAHESGIVHRDLKPGNVMLTADERAKILDFGLAKAPAAGSPGSGALVHSPTLTHSPTTIPGVILGTAAYLSPEQARGRAVDRRADIWAFGCILYECLSGKAPFSGETVSDLIARILEREPDWSALPPDTPPRIRALMEKCLRKDPRERLRDIGDARLDLTEVLASPAAGMTPDAGAADAAAASRGASVRPGAPALWIGAAVAAVIGTLLVLAGARVFGPRAPEPRVRRFAISAPQLALDFDSPPRISPDGRYVLYSSGNRLSVRDLERFEPMEVAGSEGAWSCFWSDDSRRIGYFKNGKLWAADPSGAHTIPVCDIPGGLDLNNADWGPDGNIVFARYLEGLYAVSAAGGEPRLLLQQDSTEVDFHHPQFLPDGRHLVAVAHRKSGPQVVIVVSYPEGVRKNIGEFERLSTVRYSPTGHLLLSLARGIQEIRAVPFSTSGLEITGEPRLVVAGGLFPSVSSDGTLAYYLGSASALRELVWVDRDGRVERVPGPPQLGLDHPAISPDGRRVAAVTYESGNADLWFLDPARGTRSRLVAGPGDQVRPQWTPDDSRVIYLDEQSYGSAISEVSSDGSGAPRRWGAGSWLTVTRDGRTVLYEEIEENRQKLFRLDLRAGATAVVVTPNPATRELNPALSPDGRWLAYLSDEPGTFEVFVRSYPDGAQKRQVSLNGGEWPFWKADGRALYYWERGALMEAPVGTGGALDLGAPRRLFTANEVGVELETGFRPPACAAAPDGRFLMVRREAGDPTSGILLVQNWVEEFRKQGPGK